jgi:hypothetical protein
MVEKLAGFALAALATLTLSSRSAADDARPRCFAAYEQGQRLRGDGKLCAARDQFATCKEKACPSFVRSDCAGWLVQVDARISTIVVASSSEPKSEEKARVMFFIDGELVNDAMDGHAISVDPGEHELRYALDGRSVEKHVVVPEGQKPFSFVVDWQELEPPPAPVKPPPPKPVQADARRSTWLTRFPTPTYVLGGVSVVGLVSFAGFALAGWSIQSCAPTCSQSQVSSLRSEYAIADASLGVAVAAGAGALWFALTAKPPASSDGARAPSSTSSWWLGVHPTTGGIAGAAGTSF